MIMIPSDLCRSNFNPRSPWGERLPLHSPYVPQNQFQSTLPVGGATCIPFIFIAVDLAFQSTLPVGGATLR